MRPTADRVREAWMSMLRTDLEDALVIDLCAGSGALGLEALSRGAAEVHFVERAAASLRVLEQNIETLGAQDRVQVKRADAAQFVTALSAGAYDVAFADPPYADSLALLIAEQWLRVPFAAVLSIEHDARVTLPGGSDTRRYGATALTFFR